MSYFSRVISLLHVYGFSGEHIVIILEFTEALINILNVMARDKHQIDKKEERSEHYKNNEGGGGVDVDPCKVRFGLSPQTIL